MRNRRRTTRIPDPNDVAGDRAGILCAPFVQVVEIADGEINLSGITRIGQDAHDVERPVTGAILAGYRIGHRDAVTDLPTEPAGHVVEHDKAGTRACQGRELR